MAFRFDFGETFSRAAHAAEEVAKGASEVIGSAAKDAASAARGCGERHRRYGRLGIRSRRKRHVLGCGRSVERRRADRVVRCGQSDRRGRERGGRNRRRRRNGFGPGSVVPRVRRCVDRRRRHQCHQGELVLRAPPQGAHQRVPVTASSRGPTLRARSGTTSSTPTWRRSAS